MIKKNTKVQETCAKKNVKCKYLVINGTRYRTLYNSKFQNRKKWVAPDPTKILSYIPGTIQDVFVKEGQEIKLGDPIVTLEAMKMRNVITSHADGKIIKLNVKTGDRIPKGHLLIQLSYNQ